MLRTGKKLKTEFRTAMFFLLPSLTGFVLFLIIPIVFSFLISFTNYTGSFVNMKFTGLHNYKLLIFNDVFWQSLTVTMVFAASCVFFQVVIGFFFAILLNGKIHAKVFFRSVLFLPVVLSSVAVCISFLFIFHPTQGPINKFLESMHLAAQPWLADRRTSLFTIVLVFIWQSFGYYMVIFLSGLQSINHNLYEAAEIDGASEVDKLLHVTIPALSPVIFFSFIIAIINAFKVFDHIYIMTGGQYGGGPAGSTNVLAFDIYKNGFLFWQVSYGAAESVILFLIILGITVLQNTLQKKWVHYDAV